MEEHHPHLVWKDWKVDFRVISAENIMDEEVKASVPNKFKGELTCWVFFYDGGATNVVYLLQDKKGLQDLIIGLLKDGDLLI